MQDDWGISAFARIAKVRQRARDKKRRQRATAALRQPPKSMELESRVFEVFETRSGLLAVRSGPVAMPYVPFLHGRVRQESRP